MPHETLTVGRRQHGDGAVPAIVGIFHELLDTVPCGWNDGHTVTPQHVTKKFVHFVDCAAEDGRLGVGWLGMSVLIDFFLGKRLGQHGLNLRPQHIARVFLQLLLGMRGKRARVNRNTQHGHTVIIGCRLGLGVKTGGRNHHRRDADILGGDAVACLLGRADAAAAVARHHCINAIFQQALLESLDLGFASVGAWEQSSRTDLAQQIDGSGGVFLKDETLELNVGHAGHERAAHQGDGLALKRLQPVGHLNHLHGRLPHRRQHVIVAWNRVTATVTAGITRLPAGHSKQKKEHAEKQQKSFHFIPSHKHGLLEFMYILMMLERGKS